MIQTTKYYDEFLRYFDMAKTQQRECNLGSIKHEDSSVNDNLMKHVELYDVVERKYAGFSQILHDAVSGWDKGHPYWHKMEAGNVSDQRKYVAKAWTGQSLGFVEWLYIFIIHRVCGSGINYAKKPSGYHNTVIPYLAECNTIPDMISVIKNHNQSMYTSVGYQFPAFPKPIGDYKKGGDLFLCEYAPRLANDLANFLSIGNKKDLREVGEFMFKWNIDNGLRRYKFQYAAVIADIADWYPNLVNVDSHFYYGKNAVECISYLAEPIEKCKADVFLDQVMDRIYTDTGSLPYNAEDVCCDFIRWVENYVRPGHDYDHIDLDQIWSSCTINDHPFGRQKAMLELGLVSTFNGIKNHPSDDAIIKAANLTVEQYKTKVRG